MNYRNILLAILSNQYLKLLGGLFLLSLGLLLIMDWIVMPLYTRHGQAVETPDVTSLRFEDAKNKLKERGFYIVNDEERYSEEVPAGHIIEQSPPPLSNVKEGRRVYVTVSRGLQRVFVPQLVGRSQRDAELLLRQKRLVAGQIEHEHSSIHPEGVITAQSVPADAEITVNSRVDLVVSLGPEPSIFIVPQLEGRTYDDALRRLKQAGLEAGVITYRYAPNLLPNTVIRQGIEAATIVDRETTIDLELSKLVEN